jgi:hypothetical protein
MCVDDDDPDLNKCGEGFDDEDHDGLCETMGCAERVVEEGSCGTGCAVQPDNISCEQGCFDNTHYVVVDGKCVVKPICEFEHSTGGSIHPYGIGFVLNVGGMCADECTQQNLYYVKDGVCTPIESCERRKPNVLGEHPCGGDCFMDVLGAK